jgi:hypothetical protein
MRRDLNLVKDRKRRKFQNIREQMPQESTRKEQDLSIC